MMCHHVAKQIVPILRCGSTLAAPSLLTEAKRPAPLIPLLLSSLPFLSLVVAIMGDSCALSITSHAHNTHARAPTPTTVSS